MPFLHFTIQVTPIFETFGDHLGLQRTNYQRDGSGGYRDGGYWKTDSGVRRMPSEMVSGHWWKFTTPGFKENLFSFAVASRAQRVPAPCGAGWFGDLHPGIDFQSQTPSLGWTQIRVSVIHWIGLLAELPRENPRGATGTTGSIRQLVAIRQCQLKIVHWRS